MPRQLIVGVNDLASQFPAVAAEFDLILNAPETPESVTFASGSSYYWTCPEGHSYSQKVANRTTAGQNCPVCANKRVLSGFNDLESRNPEIAREWDIEANKGQLPSGIFYGSTKRVFWRCGQGHLYQTTVRSRTEKGVGCGVCSNQIVAAGINDLGTTHPQLAAEWDYAENAPLTPTEIVAGSEKKVFWRCAEGHSYPAIPANRVKGTGCTVCSGQIVLRGFNDLGTTRPDIAEEWDSSKNGETNPAQVTAGSNRKFSWLCPENHPYVATVAHRSSGKGCPYCAGQKVLVGFNDLRTTHPDLATRWDYAKNAPLNPEQVSMGTTRKVHWICEEGHSYSAGVNSKARGGGCPICADQRVLAGYNDLGTLFPEIAEEWDYKKNAPTTPADVLRGTAKKFAWKCPEGHSFQQSVLSRTNGGAGCPKCAKYGYDGTRPGILYFIKNEKLRARKIGITNRETGPRYDRILSYGEDWEVVKTFSSDDGYQIRAAELALLDWLRNTRGLGQFLDREAMGAGGGHTETFSIDGPSDAEVVEKIEVALNDAID